VPRATTAVALLAAPVVKIERDQRTLETATKAAAVAADVERGNRLVQAAAGSGVSVAAEDHQTGASTEGRTEVMEHVAVESVVARIATSAKAAVRKGSLTRATGNGGAEEERSKRVMMAAASLACAARSVCRTVLVTGRGSSQSIRQRCPKALPAAPAPAAPTSGSFR